MKKIFREITKDEFKQFLKTCPFKSYMQSVEMYERYQKTGREAYLLGVLENNKITSAGLIYVYYERFGFKAFSFPRGPLANYSKNLESFYFLLEEAKKFLKSKRGMLLQTSPNLLTKDAPKDFKTKMKKINFKYLGEYEQVKWTYVIDFAKVENLPKIKPKDKIQKTKIVNPNIDKTAEDILFRSFRTGHRRMIRYATERHNLTLRELKPEEYHIMTKLLEESGKFQGFNPREQQFFEEMNKFFDGKAVAIIAELPDKTPVAVGFFIIYGDEVIYLSGGMNRDYKQLGGQHLIQWEMIRYAYANGYEKYNFWGTNTNPNNTVYQFKQGFHGAVEESVGAYIAPLTPMGKFYLKKFHTIEHRY